MCRAIAWLGLALLGVASPLQAQTVFDQNGFGANHDSYTVLPYEYVDPLSGNLILVVTDLTLPGNAGFDLSIKRVYNSALYPNYASGSTALEENSWAGIGWRLHFGRVLHEENNDPGGTQIEMPDGSRHPLYRTGGPDGWITREFWVYNKSTHMLKMPNGMVYTFGRSVVLSLNGQPVPVQYVTQIRDPFNNTQSFTYFDSSGPPDGVAQIHQDLGQGQARDVKFNVDATLKGLASMNYTTSTGSVNLTWTYTQAAFGPTGYHALTGVQPPAGLSWAYQYESTPGYVGLTEMDVPGGGGKVTYTYGDANRVAGSTTQRTRVVLQRTIGGLSITPGTWTFQYGRGPNQDTSIVSCPCGTTSYVYNGTGVNGSFASWSAGTLAQRTISDTNTGAVLETETLTWQPSEPVSSDAVPGVNGLWTDPAVYVALPTQRVITRDSDSTRWTTTFEYQSGQGTFNDYGRAWRITESGNLTRVTTRTFVPYNFFVLYIVDRVALQTVTIAGESATSSTGYDPATGFATSATVLGVTTNFQASDQGNVAVVTDTNSHQTRFLYQWGVRSSTIAPLAPRIDRLIDEPGEVLYDYVGALTTKYEYDNGLRPLRIRPPNANPITYEYDQLNQGWINISRITQQNSYQLDGFGRPVATNNFVNLRTATTRDACGRVVFQSAPYTTGGPSRGVTTQYDALGRVTQITAADGTSTTRYVYNGLSLTITDAANRVSYQASAGFGDPRDARLSWVQDATTRLVYYTYDVLGHLTRVHWSGSAAPPDRVWAYNGHGWLDHDTQPESGTTSYLYDAVGNVTQVTDAAGQVTNLTYDANDRLLTRDTHGTEASATFTYDELGRLSTQQSPVTKTTFTYDTAGRLASRADGGFGQPQNWVSTYTYDGNDNLTQLTYPISGRVVTYSYTWENRLTGIKQNGTDFATNFSYDDSGRLASYVTGAVTHAVTYDTRDRVAHLTSGITGGTPALDLTYHYSPVSQVLAIDDPRTGMNQAFGYDALDRLTTANGPYGALAWTYDAPGNRLTETRAGATTNYTYDPATQRLTGLGGATTESFTYDAIGQLTIDRYGSYSYLPNGALRNLTGPAGSNLSAAYYSDVDGQRTIHRVSDQGTYNTDTYTIRGAGGHVLTEVVNVCNTTVSSRDLIYAGTRLIGAVKTVQDLPTFAFTQATITVPESAGQVTFAARIVTPNGAPLGCSITVAYETQAGSAAPGTNYVGTRGTFTVPAGAASGTTFSGGVTILDDGMYDPDLTFRMVFTSAVGARIIEPSSVTVTIQNVDPPPTLTINDVTVNESAGQAVFTVSLSALSAFTTQVNFATQDDTAQAGSDYTATSGTLTIAAGSRTGTITVPVLNDGWVEPDEGFFVNLTNPVNATLGNTRGHGVIHDDDGGTRVTINPTLQGNYFADGTGILGYDDFVVIGNRNAVAVPALLTFVRNDGSGTTFNVTVPAAGRTSVHVADVVPGSEVSIAVQSLDSRYPLDADHSVYWGPGWQSGRSTEGVSPSQTWYFAEGSVGSFTEYITLFNPTNTAQDIRLEFDGPSGVITTQVVHIEPGPGRKKIRVNDLIGPQDHGTRIWCAAPIVAERTMTWSLGGTEREGHSTPGVTAGSTTWYFAEGSTGFVTYLSLLNLDTTNAASVNIEYLHENGTAYLQQLQQPLPPLARVTVQPPSWLPAGNFGYRITSSTSIVAERSVYTGPPYFSIGTSGVGTASPNTVWFFEEGGSGSFWSTYILLANPSTTTTANVSLSFIRDSDGAVFTSNVVVAPNQRQTVFVNTLPGVPAMNFRTEVHSDQPIVAERSTYWPPRTSSAALAASLLGTAGPSAAAAASLDTASLVNPYATTSRPTGPGLYHAVTQGEPGGDLERALAAQTPPDATAQSASPPASAFGTAATDSATTSDVTAASGWIGAHLTGGRRP